VTRNQLSELAAERRSLANVASWPKADTQVEEIDTTLLTLKGISDRPVYSEQFRESAVACQSEAVMELR
jgi:hypothetical protein